MAYENVRQRSRILNKNIESLIKKNEELAEANKRLRATLETEEARWQAEFRIAKSIYEKQLREKGLPAIM